MAKRFEELPEGMRGDINLIANACYEGGRQQADIKYKQIVKERGLKTFEAAALAEHSLRRCLSLGYISLIYLGG